MVMVTIMNVYKSKERGGKSKFERLARASETGAAVRRP